MVEVFSAQNCKDMDNAAINNIGIPSIVLMENAAIKIFDKIRNKGDSFLILCGKGNNGGDALAVSRHLLSDKKKVITYIISDDEKYSNDFKTNLNILKNITTGQDIVYINNEKSITEDFIRDIKESDVVLDGIFGVGINRELNDLYQSIIKSVNEFSRLTISIDVPSGINCDTGLSMGDAIKAQFTYTFEVLKRGFLKYCSFDYTGKVEIVKIGIPDSVKKEKSEKIFIPNEDDYKKMFPERKIYGHKGTYGRALIFAGSRGFSGAAFITCECTVRSGAGLTTLCTTADIQQALSGRLIEATTKCIYDNDILETIKKTDSIAFGPGIGINEENEKLLNDLIENSNCPIVIDADGIILLSKNKNLLKKLRKRAVLTPHPGEMAKLLGTDTSEVEKNRIEITKEVSKEYEIVLLLKGYNTVISDGINTYINPTGNSKMASGGMGDALTGIINGFLSQRIPLMEATLLAAYIHGKIADRLSDKQFIVNARDIIRELPVEINALLTKQS